MQGGGTLVLADCSIVSNGWHQSSDPNAGSSTGGRGIHAKGGLLCATNCVIAYNGQYYKLDGTDTSLFGDSGFGLWLSDIDAEIVDCRFVANGSCVTEADNIYEAGPILRITNARGAAIYATDTTLRASGCDFILNKALMGPLWTARLTSRTALSPTMPQIPTRRPQQWMSGRAS